MIDIRKIEVGSFENNCYILIDTNTGESIIIDPASEGSRILGEVDNRKVRAILITHGHSDHIGALNYVKNATGAPVGIHPEDAPFLPLRHDFDLKEGAMLKFGDIHLRVLHTPGHTDGSVCLLLGKHLLSGDTIFPGGPGNTELPGASFPRIIKAIHEKIFVLPEDTVIHPGHGMDTTVVREKVSEAYVKTQD